MNVTNWAVYITGAAAGLGLWQLFRNLPTVWLMEYGESEVTPELLSVQKNMRWQDGLLMMILTAMSAGLGWQRLPHLPHFLIFAISTSLLLLIILADWKTMIIPDPLTGGVLVLAGLAILFAALRGEMTWLTLLWQIGAGFAAAGLFLLIGWIGEKLAGQEAMGMGDVKLIAVCVWLVDYRKALPLIFLAFLSASVLAFPMLIKKYFGKRADDDQMSENVLPFGPFIAVATIFIQVIGPELTQIWSAYIGLF
ncbi:MAG: A24 family peptidase [Eubacteriales bacterium]|nr:A24 family peptidase [Eubacteriales bacterium]